MKKVITRYAPSPTGKLHIGGARTAIFCYLFARANKGEFIIRMEDTDFVRNIPEGESEQIDNLLWLGLEADLLPDSKSTKGPFRQSERLNIYQKYAKQLLEKKLAYKCYCTPEELQKSREEQLSSGITSPQYNRKCLHNPPKNTEGKAFSIRLFVPDDLIFSWKDFVRGEIFIPSRAIGDWVIIKSNGVPTYNFANVIDDHLMEISHVFRGEEHLANTPKQIHLYQIFNWHIPYFSHNTIIVDERGKKLSKRDESIDQFISSYREKGFLPEAVVNYLTFLGWSPKNEREIYSKKELIKIFNVDGFSGSPSRFNYQKLQWINNHYIRNLSDQELYIFLDAFLKENPLDEKTKMRIFKLFVPQIREGQEIDGLIKIFTDKFPKNLEEINKIYLENILLIDRLIVVLKQQENWTTDQIHQIISELGKELGLKGGGLMFPIRFILTERTIGPSLVDIISIFGQDKTIERLEKSKNV